MLSQTKLEGDNSSKVVTVIQAAGGSLTGRTRLQKTMYLLGIAGFLDGFEFEYRHYGPYSEELSQAALFARMSGRLTEEECRANWGGTYSIFRAPGAKPDIDLPMQEMIDVAVTSNPIALELAATAAFLATEKFENPWDETISRKPDKAKYIDAAKLVYANLARIATPTPLPAI